MFDVMFTDEARVKRATGRTAENAVTYEEVLDETGGALPVRCKLEHRGRRVVGKDGVEIQSDATMICRTSDLPGIDMEDLVVAGGRTYRVVGLTDQPLLGSGVKYSRLDLALDRAPVPGDADAG